MTEQSFSLIISVIGVLISIGLGVNAFFLKSLIDALSELKVFAKSESEGTKVKFEFLVHRMESNENNVKHIFERLYNIEKDKQC